VDTYEHGGRLQRRGRDRAQGRLRRDAAVPGASAGLSRRIDVAVLQTSR